MRELKLALSAEDFERLVRGGELIISVESYVRDGGRLVPGGGERVEARVILSDIGFPKMIEIIGEVASGVLAKKVERVREDAADKWAESDRRQGQVVLVEAIPEANAQITVRKHDQIIKDLDERTDRCQKQLEEIGEILTRIEEQIQKL